MFSEQFPTRYNVLYTKKVIKIMKLYTEFISIKKITFVHIAEGRLNILMLLSVR